MRTSRLAVVLVAVLALALSGCVQLSKSDHTCEGTTTIYKVTAKNAGGETATFKVTYGDKVLDERLTLESDEDKVYTLRVPPEVNVGRKVRIKNVDNGSDKTSVLLHNMCARK